MTEPLAELGRGLLDLLFPPVCLVCGEMGDPLCAACTDGIEPVEPDCHLPPGLDAVCSAGRHQGALREAVLLLKFRRSPALAPVLGDLAAVLIQSGHLDLSEAEPAINRCAARLRSHFGISLTPDP